MNDEAAESRRPVTPEGSTSPLPGPAPSTPHADAPDEPTEAVHPAADPTGAADQGEEPTFAMPADPAPNGPGTPPPPGGPGTPPPPPPGAGTPPPWDRPADPPPAGGAGFTSRYGLVRPRQGRYLAGVCAAIGRATNTDPVLWRVLLAVLGFFGGIGILVYLAAWLIIPAEGDTASPVESMLGRGRSSMSPVTVIVLGVLVAVMFGLIVTDKFRAVLLGAAILILGALLLNRNGVARDQVPAPVTPFGAAPPPGTTPAAAGMPARQPFSAADAPPLPPFPPAVDRSASARPPYPRVTPGGPYPGGPYPAGPYPGATYPGGPYPGATYPASPYPGATYPAATAGGPGPAGASTAYPAGPPPAGRPYPPAAGPTDPPAWSPAGPPPLDRGYRPAFAPRGPYSGTGPYPPGVVPEPPRPPKPPKPPKERSALGAATFSMIFVAIGVVVILDLANTVTVAPSTYFAAALVTIALGLLIGTWFGRARWLIALGLAASAALGISTLAESYDRVRSFEDSVVWEPADYGALADRYENTFGDSVLDLRKVDFTGHDSQVSVQVNFGKLRVLVPPSVDVTTSADVNAGDVQVFGSRWGGVNGRNRETTDLGPDGPGGGKLRLNLHVNAGNLEVTR